MNFNLYKQIPKSSCKIGGISGYVNGDEKSISMFLKDDTHYSDLESPRIKYISADGIMLYGFEPDGYDKHGIKKSKYQEWFLTENKGEK